MKGEFYLGEINIEEKGLFGVGDLNVILLVRVICDAYVVHCLRNLLH